MVAVVVINRHFQELAALDSENGKLNVLVKYLERNKNEAIEEQKKESKSK